MDQLETIFDTKYTEFAGNLLEAVPELDAQIRGAMTLSAAERLARFKAEVLPSLVPGKLGSVRTVLPGVTLTEGIWQSLEAEGQKAVGEFLSVLGVCCSHESEEWSRELFEQWKESMASIDFESLAKKFAASFGQAAGAGGAGSNPFQGIPERLLKGQLAKFINEIVAEIKPEDFGLTPEMIADMEKTPTRAFEILTEVYTKNPGKLQAIMKRIVGRLQDKIRRGQLKPQEIAKEAEELLKELTENSAFKDLLESLKDSFGLGEDDEDVVEAQRAAGRDGDARRNIVRERLRKKMAAKKGAR